MYSKYLYGKLRIYHLTGTFHQIMDWYISIIYTLYFWKYFWMQQMELNKSWADAPFIQFYVKIGARMKSLEIFN